MSKDLVSAVTSKSILEMKSIVDNWVLDDNFTKTGTSKGIALGFQKILEGFEIGDPNIVLAGMKTISDMTKDTHNLKKN